MLESKQELSDLKDQISAFKENPIWHYIVIYMQNLYMEAAESALNASDISEVRFAKGIAHAVQMITRFDEHVKVLKVAQGVNNGGRE